ncbi:MAG: hypothetical protein HeimC3_44060 [Candidatus Heimdallarchaeota archaeon LC_3]|nr:MAG: hypothetical protein HeimC3_44060 [Candidatus Heimdallarchaeota archaeon LC_3]
MVNKINLSNKFSLFRDLWSPKIIADLNDSHVKLAKVKGEFVWHKHDDEDELFLVVKGKLKIELRDKELFLYEGEIVVIPKGVEHKPVADSEVQILLIETKGTVNTGDVTDEKTKKGEEFI